MSEIVVVITGATGPSGSGGGSTALDDLTDVTITAAASGDILRHNGTAWVDTPGATHFEVAGAAATAQAAAEVTASAALSAHTGDTVDAHDASAISFVAGGTIAATDVQTAVAEVATDAASALSTHDADTTNVHGIADTSVLLTTTAAPELIRDTIGTALVAGTNVTITVNDGADTITIAASGGGGSVATDTIFDAKGDLPVGTGADTAAKLAVGSTGTALMADSSTASGLIWARPQFSQRLITGRYYAGGHGYDVAESAAWGADQVIASPFWVPEKTSIDRLGFAVTTAVASSTVYLGMYLADDTGGLPGTLIVAGSGTLDTSTTGGKEYTVSASIGPGVVWAVSQIGSTGGGRTRTIQQGQRFTLGRGALTDTNPMVSISTTRTAAALPASLSGTSWTSYSTSLPHGIQVRIA